MPVAPSVPGAAIPGMVRRDLLRVAGATGLLAGLAGSSPTYAQTPAAGAPGLASIGGSPIDLVIEKVALAVDGRIGSANCVFIALPCARICH